MNVEVSFPVENLPRGYHVLSATMMNGEVLALYIDGERVK